MTFVGLADESSFEYKVIILNELLEEMCFHNKNRFDLLFRDGMLPIILSI